MWKFCKLNNVMLKMMSKENVVGWECRTYKYNNLVSIHVYKFACTSLYTTLMVVFFAMPYLSWIRICIPFLLCTRESATYSWPWQNTGFDKYINDNFFHISTNEQLLKKTYERSHDINMESNISVPWVIHIYCWSYNDNFFHFSW